MACNNTSGPQPPSDYIGTPEPLSHEFLQDLFRHLPINFRTTPVSALKPGGQTFSSLMQDSPSKSAKEVVDKLTPQFSRMVDEHEEHKKQQRATASSSVK